MNKQELMDKIASRDLVCGTVGLGYVGLPLAVEVTYKESLSLRTCLQNALSSTSKHDSQ